jgi:hypothetical protein
MGCGAYGARMTGHGRLSPHHSRGDAATAVTVPRSPGRMAGPPEGAPGISAWRGHACAAGKCGRANVRFHGVRGAGAAAPGWPEGLGPGPERGPVVQYDIGVSFPDMTSASALLYDIGVSFEAYDISVS